MDTDESKKMNQKLLLSFIAGLIVGGGVTWFVIGSEVLSPTVDDVEDTTMTDTTGNAAGGDSSRDENGSTVMGTDNDRIIVEDQLAGDRVLLREVELTNASWVVVHEETDSFLGNALGAARLDPGVYEGGYVELLRNTETGSTYHVLMYQDNGDKEFNLDEDSIVVDAEGNSVCAIFEAIRVDRKTN